MTSDTTPQDRAVEAIKVVDKALTVNGVDDPRGVYIAAQVVRALYSAGLLSSAPQEEEGSKDNDGVAPLRASGRGASVSFDELVDWVARLEVTVKPVNGVVTIAAESMAGAFADFLRLNGIEVSRG